MKIVVFSSDSQWQYLSALKPECDFVRVQTYEAFVNISDADAYFNLTEHASSLEYNKLDKHVFINSVSDTLGEKKHGSNVVRINAWPGFLEKDLWEIAGVVDENAQQLFTYLNIKYIKTLDEPGFVTARVIAMVINEAFFAKEANVSTENEIDIAMKLGTNYPYGPFEWANKIGIKNIYDLLTKLSLNDNRYLPSEALKNSIL